MGPRNGKAYVSTNSGENSVVVYDSVIGRYGTLVMLPG